MPIRKLSYSPGRQGKLPKPEYPVQDNNIKGAAISLDGTVLWQAMDIFSDFTLPSPLSQIHPRIVPGGNGSVIVIWESCSDDYILNKIYAQKLNLQGQKLWFLAGLQITNNLAAEKQMSLATDIAGNSYIIWQDSRNSQETGYDLYGQKLNPNGVTQWEMNGRQIVDTPGEQSQPGIVFSGDLLCLGWKDITGGMAGICCNVMNPAGSWLLPDTQQNVITGNDDSNSVDYPILLPRSNGVCTLWIDNRYGFNNQLIYYQYVDGDGNILLDEGGRPIALNSTNEQQSMQAIITPDDYVAVIWREFINNLPHIFAQLIDPLGNRLWGGDGVQVTLSLSSQSYTPGLSYSEGAFYFTWIEDVDVVTPHGNDSYGRVLGQKIVNPSVG